MSNRQDRTSAQYKRELRIVAVIVTVLTLSGGAMLGYRIDGAEKAQEAQRIKAEKFRMENPDAKPDRLRYVR